MSDTEEQLAQAPVEHTSAFGQLVTGPPGAGKTTYCNGLHQFLTALGRPVHIVNLDPAVPNPPYPCSINLTELITLDGVMAEYGLGPNGAMLYCVEYLEANFDWLVERLDEVLGEEGGNGYVVFDTPGQVEIWTNHDSLKNVVGKLMKMDYRLAAVHLSDAHYITDASKFISVVLLALRAMLQMEMPHLNVLSKIDLISTYGELPFDLSYYTEVQDMSYLLHKLNEEPRAAKFGKLNEAMVELVEGFGLVGFETLAVEDKESMLNIVRQVDKMTGYIFVPHSGDDDGTNAINTQALFGSAFSGGRLLGRAGGDVRDVQERWVDNKEAWDEWEKEGWKMEGEMRARLGARGPGGVAAGDEVGGGQEGGEVGGEGGEEGWMRRGYSPTGFTYHFVLIIHTYIWALIAYALALTALLACKGKIRRRRKHAGRHEGCQNGVVHAIYLSPPPKSPPSSPAV